MDNNKKNVLTIISETRIIHILLSIVLGFVVGAFFLLIMGLDVGAAYGRLITSVTSVKGFSYVIVYAIPYIMTGLSVAFSFRTGIFNIGAEGQFVLGSMAAACIGILLGDLPSVVLIPLCFIGAMLAGALWGAIVGILKNRWGINEVLSMIMFNWIAFYLSNFIAGIPAIHSDGTAEATKNISDNASTLLSKDLISQLGLCPTANWGILVSLVMMLIVWLIIDKTTLGYRLKAVGANKSAAEYGGINVNRSILTALALSRATMRNIRQNLGWAFGYNLLGLPVAAGLLHVFGGPMLSPMIAGTAMALSSFSVVSNALRLRFFKV